MQSQSVQDIRKSESQINDIMDIPLHQRRQYALKTTEFMSRWKQGKNFNSYKWKHNLLTQLTNSNIQHLSQNYNASIFRSINELLTQMIYLIYGCAMNKVNLLISTNVYVTSKHTIFGVYYLLEFNITKKYEELRKSSKSVTLTLDEFRQIFETNEFKLLCSRVDELKQKLTKSAVKVLFENESDFLFYNFQFRNIVGENDLKQAILHSIKVILNKLYLNRKQSPQLHLLTQRQMKQLNQDFICQLENIPATWSDPPMKYLEHLQREIQLFRNSSFTGKYKTHSFETMLLNDEAKSQLLIQNTIKQKEFYQNFINAYHLQSHSNIYQQSPIFITFNQNVNDFNHVTNKGVFVIQETFFKYLNFIKNTNFFYPQHFIIQQIQTVKRQILLRKTGDLIEVLQSLVNVGQQEHLSCFGLDYEPYQAIVNKARQHNLREVDVLNDEINRKLYMAEITLFQTLKQAQSQQARIVQIINAPDSHLAVQFIAFRLQMFSSSPADSKSKNETIPEEKPKQETKNPIIQFAWVVKYLRNFLLEKELYKCQVNKSLLLYLPQIRLICPQKIRQENYKQLERELVNLKNGFSIDSTPLNEILTTSLVKINQNFHVLLMISFNQHNLSDFIYPLICSIGSLITYYFNLEKILKALEVQSFPEEKQNSTDEEATQIYQQELEILRQRLPHHLQLTRSIHFALKEKISQNP